LKNNNNNNPLPLPSSGFEGSLRGDFNSPPGKNAEGLDPNIKKLVNALIGVNLKINHVERETNHVKSTEFGRIKVEDLNE